MSALHSFSAKYADLCRRFSRQAEADGDVYLPNLPISKPADHIFISMEPSLGHWAPGRDPEARRRAALEKIGNGFRNFIFSYNNHVFHYCVKAFFCNSNETYHLTDLSKGAMTVSNAARKPYHRYAGWYDLLQEELQLVSSSNARYYAVGKRVVDFLKRAGFKRPVVSLYHYSQRFPNNTSSRAREFPVEYLQFSKTVSHEAILETAANVFEKFSIPHDISSPVYSRLLKKKNLSESFKQLMFSYKKASGGLMLSGK